MTEDRGARNAIGQMARPVEVPWTCKRSGDCCRVPSVITMTQQERALLEPLADRASRPLVFTEIDGGFAQLAAAPCPFLNADDECNVYDVRPYVCRRFMCGRVDLARESFEAGGPMGCFNASDRMETSLRFVEFYRAHQRRTVKTWALDHGWRPDVQGR